MKPSRHRGWRAFGCKRFASDAYHRWQGWSQMKPLPSLIAVAALALFPIPFPARAGLLDDLRDTAEEKTKAAAQEATDEAKQRAQDAAQQGPRAASDQAQQKAEDAASNAQQSGDQPVQPAESGPASDTPPAPAESAPSPPGAPTTAGADQSFAPPPSDQSAVAPVQRPPLPPRGAITVEMRSRGLNDEDPSAPASEFPSSLRTLHVRVLENKDTGFACWVKLTAVDVPGLARDQVLATSASAPAPGWSEEAGKDIFDTFLDLPRMLPAGRYRLDLVEENPPYRVAASFPLMVSAAPASSLGPCNLADPETGGLLEWATGEDGAGASWSYRLLMPDNDRVWEPLVPTGDDLAPPPLPWELVISFFGRQSALVSTVEITANSPDDAPHDVEIWGSSESATAEFTKLAAYSASEPKATLVVPVPPTSVRFLKIRLVSKNDDVATLRITGVRVREGAADGYVPLARRFPELAQWKLQPRYAAQAGLFYLQASAVDFQHQESCIGCHVQAQALMGLTIAGKNDYVVSEAARSRLVDFIRRSQFDAGCFARSPEHDRNQSDDQSNTALCALGLSYGHRTADDERSLLRGALWLATQQNDDGSVVTSDEREPVTQGLIFQTSNCLDVWAETLKQGDNPKLGAAAARGLVYIEKAEPATTQDEVFKVLAFVRHGNEEQKKLAHQLCAELLQQQQPDGGWPVDPADKDSGSKPFSTGEVLYTLRVAGTSVRLPAFQRGVRWLISEQRPDGAWESPPCTTQFASTMWPVIALVGAFTTKAEPAHIMVAASPRPPPPRPPPVVAPPPAPAATVPDHIEFILDCSFSMDSRLGNSTRLDTARAVLRDLIAKLPDSASVGLRLYGYRFDSMSSQSSTDTQLVVPIQPLNRAALLKQVNGASAHGQTPLVYSTLQAVDDLKRLGGGTIILVTDGEESCGGRPRQAGAKIVALGVPVRLFIIGFTLKGQRIANEMMAFAQPTGGRYYTAADGPQLAAALTSAVSAKAPVVAPPPPPEIQAPPLPPDLPYEIFNAQGEKVAAGTTLGTDSPDLEPGAYRVVVHDGAKTATVDGVIVDASETVELRYSPADGGLKRLP